MSKVYVLSHGTSDPDYGFERDGVRVFSNQDKARKALEEMFEHDVGAMTEYAEEDLYSITNEPDKYFVEGNRRDAFKAFIEEITLE